jgi:hypothetical protein
MSPLTPSDNPEAKVHCYAYACPAVMTLDLAERHRKWISTVIYNDDIVPRLSFGSLLDLKARTCLWLCLCLRRFDPLRLLSRLRC